MVKKILEFPHCACQEPYKVHQIEIILLLFSWFLLHTVEIIEFYSQIENISWNHMLFSNFFHKDVTFTKVLFKNSESKFLWFPHCWLCSLESKYDEFCLLDIQCQRRDKNTKCNRDFNLCECQPRYIAKSYSDKQYWCIGKYHTV